MINVDEDKDYTTDRLDGYRLALLEHGLSPEDGRVIYAPNSVDGGAGAVRRILELEGCTAAFCATDTIAIGAASELARAGRTVPEDFSLVGFDGLGHQLLATPPLTSVQQPVYEIGEQLARALLDRLDGRGARPAPGPVRRRAQVTAHPFPARKPKEDQGQYRSGGSS